MPRLLTLDASGGQVLVAVVVDDVVVSELIRPAAHGQSALLAPMVLDVLAASGFSAAALDGVAVIAGPGGFTGLRASIALAHGISLAAPCPVVGVTLAEAMAQAPVARDGRVLWTVIDSRRGRIFLHDGTPFRAVRLDDLPTPLGPVAIAGDAAEAVAGLLRGRGHDAMLIDARQPRSRDIARAAIRRLIGDLPPLPARPLYVDPPEATPPAGGTRPAPVGWSER